MQNCGAISGTNQQPVLLFDDLLSQKKIREVPLLPIGAKIKSFRIAHPDCSDSANLQELNQKKSIKLPEFANLQSYSLNLDNEQIVSQFSLPNVLPVEPQVNFRTVKRFWWHWLLASSTQISILVSLILFQSSSQANNLLEKAKIYIDLDSHEATTLPADSTALLDNSQASPFNRAIRQSREIEADSPFYPEAQADILRWSEVILDIARGRAVEGNLAGAIAAAQLIPQNHSATKLIAQEATAAVQDWELRAKMQNINRDYLAKAKAKAQTQLSAKFNQASSYNQAIAIARQIAPGANEYQEAQNLIDQWNKQIYQIVEQRVATGNFQQAVEAAVLITPDSSHYQLAQEAINLKIKSMYVQYVE